MRSADAALVVIMLLVVWSFYRAQKDPTSTFNLFDLVMENGRVSKLASVFTCGVVVLSWIMVRLTLDGKMTEGYVGLYGGTVIAPVIAKLFSPPATPGTVTTDTRNTVTQTVGSPKGESP